MQSSNFLTAICSKQSNKLLCAWHSAIYQVAFRRLFWTFSDVYAHLLNEAGAHPYGWGSPNGRALTLGAGANPHFGAHKQAGTSTCLRLPQDLDSHMIWAPTQFAHKAGASLRFGISSGLGSSQAGASFMFGLPWLGLTRGSHGAHTGLTRDSHGAHISQSQSKFILVLLTFML